MIINQQTFSFLDTKERVNVLTVAMNNVDTSIIKDIKLSKPGDDEGRTIVVQGLHTSYLELIG